MWVLFGTSSTTTTNPYLFRTTENGTAPDIAIFPQPGLMAELAEAGQLVPLTRFMEIGELRAAYPDAWLSLGTFDDTLYALWYRASVKSLIWYNPTAFSEKGYDVPQSWPQLMALSERIIADGGTPWCIGLGSGEATGWPGTDWIEDILLRKAGPEAYQHWIDHRLAFDSSQVLDAFDTFDSIMRSPGFVAGGAASAATTDYGESALGLFMASDARSPACYLHRQASFVVSFFPSDKAARVDYDAFLLPGIDSKFGLPVLVAGDALGLLKNTPEAQQLMKYFATPVPHEIMASLGDAISPHRQIDIGVHPNLVSQNIARFLAEADIIRFDGSDMMPGAVGTDSFWDGMVDFANGKSAEEVTKSIDASWPE